MHPEKSDQKIVVHIPVCLKTWGGRKVVVGPTGQDLRKLERSIRVDEKLLNALGRAYKWRRWIDSGKCQNAEDISAREDINKSYVLRILRLNRLSPKIIEAILDGRQPDGFGLTKVERPFPLLWMEQEEKFGFI